MDSDELLSGEFLFEVETPLNFTVRTTAKYWKLITTVKHPVMHDKLDDVCRTLSDPDEVRQSKSDTDVYLFYRQGGDRRWVCAVTKQLDTIGFLITAYRTSAIKAGITLWQK